MKKIIIITIVYFAKSLVFAQMPKTGYKELADSVAFHRVIVDSLDKIVPWFSPRSMAYDEFLRKRWHFIYSDVPNSPGPAPRSDYPQYYFYCAYKNAKLDPDTWMNDIGEKIPNWFESARLYYQYTGDSLVMSIIRNFVNYTIDHGTSPSSFSWPNFPYTTTNAGDLDFRGFTNSKRLVLHEVQVDHAGDIGLTYFKLFLYTGEEKFKLAAIHVADVLASNARTGSAIASVWPYRVVMSTGQVTAPYGANWFGCYALLDNLVKAKLGNIAAYRLAMNKAKDFILHYPMKTGYWTDGHTDTDVKSNVYRSNMSASNATLYLLDHPDFDPDFKLDVPKLIMWTEKYFIFRSAPGEPSMQWGAHIVGEQDSFLYKMDYQTARYAAECAGWYAASGDTSYKEKAYRSLNWVTYCSDSNGMASESPLSKGITSWWSDCYGEGPRMFYHAFAAVPAWAPPGENHLLYSTGILKKVMYGPGFVHYTATDYDGIETLRLIFNPANITIDGKRILRRPDLSGEGFTVKTLGQGDYVVQVKRSHIGAIIISNKDVVSQ
jgi:hypothetical protein